MYGISVLDNKGYWCVHTLKLIVKHHRLDFQMFKPACYKMANLVNTPSLLCTNHFSNNDSDIINWNLLSLDQILKIFEQSCV